MKTVFIWKERRLLLQAHITRQSFHQGISTLHYSNSFPLFKPMWIEEAERQEKLATYLRETIGNNFKIILLLLIHHSKCRHLFIFGWKNLWHFSSKHGSTMNNKIVRVSWSSERQTQVSENISCVNKTEKLELDWFM